MPVSPLQAAKRVLVSLLLSMARQYNVTINANRDSPDKVVEQAFKKVALKAHPDKSGSNEERGSEGAREREREKDTGRNRGGRQI